MLVPPTQPFRVFLRNVLVAFLIGAAAIRRVRLPRASIARRELDRSRQRHGAKR